MADRRDLLKSAERRVGSAIATTEEKLSAESDKFSAFCFMVLEEFMMKKGLNNTLQAFRSEFPVADQVCAMKF
jgi:hypothetical protein